MTCENNQHRDDGRGRCIDCGAYLPDPDVAVQWAEEDRAKLELCDRLCALADKLAEMNAASDADDCREAAELIRLTVE